MFFHSLRKHLSRRTGSKNSRPWQPRPRTSRLFLEPLEDRFTPAPMLAVGDITVLEANTGTHNAHVTVSLSGSREDYDGDGSVTVNYATADGSALAGSDYNAVSGKLTFKINEMSKSIPIPIRGDRLPELDESFFLRLSNSRGAKIADGEGIVTIVDDEPRITISDASAPEGNAGATPMTFTVNLSVQYDLPVTVKFATSDGSATAGTDYAAASGTITFAPYQTSQTITVMVNGNKLAETDKTFSVNVSAADSFAAITKGTGVGTIIDDEPRIYISDAYNYGESTMTFTVSLTGDHDDPVTVKFTTVDGTAIAGVDYLASVGTLTFGPHETTQTITIQVLDPTSLPDKYFYIQLSGASANAMIGNESAVGYWYYDYGYPGDCGCYDYYYYYGY